MAFSTDCEMAVLILSCASSFEQCAEVIRSFISVRDVFDALMASATLCINSLVWISSVLFEGCW